MYEAKGANAELLAFTLDKSSGAFSPTTRYRDYAISRTLIHWESQSMTRADSETGLRYHNHERDGRSIMLFTRLRADDRAFWFLGPATYRGHVGEKPMAITWELHTPLPGDLLSVVRRRGRLTPAGELACGREPSRSADRRGVIRVIHHGGKLMSKPLTALVCPTTSAHPPAARDRFRGPRRRPGRAESATAISLAMSSNR